MAVVSMMKMSGDPDELAAKLRSSPPVGRELGPQHGGLGTIVCRTDDGIMIINLWENERGPRTPWPRSRGPGGGPGRRLPQPAFEGYEVL